MIPQVVVAASSKAPDKQILVLSRGMALPFLLIFCLYILFRLSSNAYFLDERVYLREEPEQEPFGPFPVASVLVVVLFMVTVCGNYLVGSIAPMAEATKIDTNFLSAVLLPLVISISELAPAVFYTYGDTMNLAISVVVGCSMQIALFVMPFLVILGWTLDVSMELTGRFELLHLFLAVLVLNYQIQDGNSTYLASTICMAT